MKKLLIYPNSSPAPNFYINNLADILKDNYEIYGMSEEKKKGFFKLFKGDIFHFNWYESIDSSSYMKTLINYYKRKFLVNCLKLTGKKIVWTMHNNQPHNSKYLSLNIKMMKFLANRADRIHVLCKDTINNSILHKYKTKVVYIPHGDYIGNYGKSAVDIYKRYNIDINKKIILFIGQVRKYKNIELLINAFNVSKIASNDFILLICGNCSDKKYQQELESISNENIFFDFNFIKDEEMEAYLKNSRIVVAPYDKESSLNSGTLWMTMSYHRTMILPLIGCVKDVENYDNLLYVYDYCNPQEHLLHLVECLKTIKDDDLIKKGQMCYDYMINNQTWQKYKKAWIDLFRF